VTGAVDVSVVAVGGFVLNVGGVDGDTALFFFGSRVDLVVGLGDGAAALCRTLVIAAVKDVLPWST